MSSSLPPSAPAVLNTTPDTDEWGMVVRVAGSGSSTVNQGTPNTVANGWPVKLTDGVNVLGTVLNPLYIQGAVTISGTPNVNIATWLGSSAPTVGQKAMAASLPVAIASDQTALAVGIAALPSWATTRVTVGVAAGQLDGSPLANRKSISIKALASNTDTCYIGTSNGVTTGNGYPLAAGESVVLDISAAVGVWAISGTAAQAVSTLEVAGTP